MSKTATYNHAVEFISRWMPFLGYVLISLMGKFGYDLVSNRRITIKYIAGTTGIAIFVGWVAYKWCMAHNDLNPGITVSIAALFSRDLIVFATMIDKKKLFEMLFNKGKSIDGK